MIDIRSGIRPDDLRPGIDRLWDLSAAKLRSLAASWGDADGEPVFTAGGRYRSQGWSEWTLGFRFGSELLQFDATGARPFLRAGRRGTLERLGPALTHAGVHDHGFNVVSTYGNLLRLAREGRFAAGPWECALYETALKVSGAVQARRWTRTADGGGFIHSFNGPHSLFADAMRTLRSLAIAHALGHVLCEEGDARVSLLGRLVAHAHATAAHAVFHGRGRDAWDERGRVAHESLFNPADGRYRCPGTQQGYSPFTTWTRGQAWVLLGFAEQLEFLATRGDRELAPLGGRARIESEWRAAACAAADHYIRHTPPDGVPYWDTGAPGLARLDDPGARPADPWTAVEPVDSSAAAIAAQGLLRLGRWLDVRRPPTAAAARDAGRFVAAGLRILKTLLAEPYLSTDPRHQGLLLHSVYHRPRGWDRIPRGRRIPCGESSLWGDYHLREAALYVGRWLDGGPRLVFWPPDSPPRARRP